MPLLCAQTPCLWATEGFSVDITASSVVSGFQGAGEYGESQMTEVTFGREEQQAAALCARLQRSCRGSGGGGAGSSKRGRDCFHLHAALSESGSLPSAGITETFFYLSHSLLSQDSLI